MLTLKDVKTKINSWELWSLTELFISRFGQGLGVSIDADGKRIFLVPEVICEDALGHSGIVICYEGGGAYVYRGDRELNEYILVSANFPLQVAKEISRIINALMTQYDRMRNDVSYPDNKEVEDLLRLTHRKES